MAAACSLVKSRTGSAGGRSCTCFGWGLPPESRPKEVALSYRRTVFTHDDWIAHRSTWRYFRHIRGLFRSRIVRALLTPLAVIVFFATFLCSYETLRQAGILIPTSWPRLTIQDQDPFNMTAFAISLLLVFRTTESYTRWAEARRIWGGILNRSRDITRQAFTWFHPDDDILRAALVRWAIAGPYAMMAHLRRVSTLDADLQDVLMGGEMKALMAAEHRPNFVFSMLSEIVRRADLPHMQMMMFDQNLTFFADCIGSCERIFKTPIPLSYTRHTSRFMVVWLIFLPIQLWDTCGWGTVPAAALIAFLLLGIDEIGVMIEEPFSTLPLDAICETARRNLREIAERQTWARSFLDTELDCLASLSPKARGAWPPSVSVSVPPPGESPADFSSSSSSPMKTSSEEGEAMLQGKTPSSPAK